MLGERSQKGKAPDCAIPLMETSTEASPEKAVIMQGQAGEGRRRYGVSWVTKKFRIRWW